MQRFFLILISTLLAFLASLVFPWWISLLLPAVLAAWLANSATTVFLLSCCPTALLWTMLCLASMVSGSDLPGRVATLFFLPHSSLLLLITVLIGGLLSGLAGACLHSIRMVVLPDTHT